ncbi:unnamed protein product, partial [Mycena citricolor]
TCAALDFWILSGLRPARCFGLTDSSSKLPPTSRRNNFAKPNHERALQLRDRAARDLIEHHVDIVLAFGESDEITSIWRRPIFRAMLIWNLRNVLLKKSTSL